MVAWPATDSDWEEETGYQLGQRRQWRPSGAPCHGGKQVFNADWEGREAKGGGEKMPAAPGSHTSSTQV